MAADLVKSKTPPLPRRRPDAGSRLRGDAAGARADRDGADEASFWPKDRRPADATRGEVDAEADRRVVDDVRRRAREGDAQSRGLCFRAARGFARPVDLTPETREAEPLDPEVASAMLRAGLLALGLEPDEPLLDDPSLTPLP